MNGITTKHEVADNVLDAIDYCYEQGWTDGLPVVPPEASRVAAMLQMEGRPFWRVATRVTTNVRGCVPGMARTWSVRTTRVRRL